MIDQPTYEAASDSRRLFFRYDEAAAFIHAVSGAIVSTNTIRSWVRKGVPSIKNEATRYYLPARQINRANVISRQDLINWLSNDDINIAAGAES